MALPALSPGLKTFLSKLTTLAAQIFGEPTDAEQAEAFIFLLLVIGLGIPVLLVAVAYLYFWLVDLRQKNKATLSEPAFPALGTFRTSVRKYGIREGMKNAKTSRAGCSGNSASRLDPRD
jgi:hypothetical protein